MPRHKSAIAASHDAAAEHLCCSVQRIREMVREEILPPGVLDLDEARRLTLEWLRRKASGKTPKTAALEDARSESIRIDIEKKQLELAELRGQLGRLEVWEEELRNVFATIRAKLLTLPSKCAALVSPDAAPVVQEQVKNGVHEALREIAHGSVPNDPGSGQRRTRAHTRSDAARGDSGRAT
jgi:hypothetical protein